jgi:Co/Zn/Cd efflux system component
MLLLGLGVLGEAAHKAFHPAMPVVETMGIVGGLALAANLVCFSLLYRHRGDNLNMSSTWLCSRNDLIANVAVLAAAAGSFLLASRWPDLLVGAMIASLFIASALKVLRQSVAALRAPPAPPSPVAGRVTVSLSRGSRTP